MLSQELVLSLLVQLRVFELSCQAICARHHRVFGSARCSGNQTEEKTSSLSLLVQEQQGNNSEK